MKTKVKDESAHIKKKRADFARLTVELAKGQKEMSDGNVTQARGEEIEAKFKEAKALQDELGLYASVTSMVEEGEELDGEILSPDAGNGRHYRRPKGRTPGELFVRGKSFRSWKDGAKKDWSDELLLPYLEQGARFELTPEAAKDFDAEDTPVPDLGNPSILQPFRDSDQVRTTERTVLRMRDVVRVVPTSSGTIEWVKYTPTAGADMVAPTEDKPYGGTAFELATTAVRTIAVLQKITEQQLEDAPQLMSIINDEMSYDLRRKEEAEMTWGDGTGQHLAGIFKSGNSIAIDGARYNIDPDAGAVNTHLDIIRKIITDITTRGYAPNALTIHPLDWEGIELLKGTDSRYVWAVIQTLLGPRVWGLSVVETTAMLNPAGDDRRFAVGDFIRGTALYDRHDVRLAIGLVDDDFRKNLKTLRAEERVGFAFRRAGSVEHYQTLPVETVPSS